MAGDGARVEVFFKYLNAFVENIRPDDPLPVRAPSYKVTEDEIDGQILDIVHHYLNGKDCPVFVRSYVAHKVWEAMRQPSLQQRHLDGGGSDGNSAADDDDSDDQDSDEDDVVDATGDMESTPVNSTYEAMKLIKEVTTKANDVIRDMSRTFTPEKVIKTPNYLPVSSFAIKNMRRKMEDRHIILRDLNTLYDMQYGEPHAFYGVFDGHAGTDAAVYTAAHLHQYLIQNPLYHMDPLAALKHAFHFADTNFIKKAKKERLKGGTTAVVALLREKRLAVAWLGDSLAVLVRRRKPIKLVEPHKPDLESERDRVNNMGGVVLKLDGAWRILGQLAVSRAIGDADYKPFISSECDIKSLEIMGDEDFLILATDGLWDTITYDEAVTFVYAYLTINQGDCEGVGRCLVEQARRQGSVDNITAVVVFLRPVDVLMEEEQARREAGEVPESEMDPSFLMKKDSAPSTIYEIFSNNVATFNPDSPSNKQGGGDYNPFSPNASNMEMENGGAALNGPPPKQNYGQAVGDEYDLSVGLPVSNTPDPTMEDVESALAELDSLPDGDNEPGNDRDDDTNGWNYNMDTLSPKQRDDFPIQEMTVEGTPAGFQLESPVTDHTEEQNGATSEAGLSNTDDHDSHKSRGSSPPASPRSVEGFVTSVELNTAQEQLTTAFGTSREMTSELMAAESGPFSVYVSSSPEPASLDALVDTKVETLPTPADQFLIDTTEVVPTVSALSPIAVESPIMHESPVSVPDHHLEEQPSVEIVHAQSMVEVVAPASPTHEPELQFVSQPMDIEGQAAQSPVYTPAPLNDLMSTSMILEEPITGAPEQVEEMMQFIPSNPEVLYNNLEQQQTAEIVHITTDTDRLASPEVESANLLDADDSEPSYAADSPIQAVVSPIPAQRTFASPVEQPMSPVQETVSPIQDNIIPAMYSQNAEDDLVEQMNRANINDSCPSQSNEFIPSPVPAFQPSIEDTDITHASSINVEHTSPGPVSETVETTPEGVMSPERAKSPISTSQTPVSDVLPVTPMKEPMINDHPISPIHTPKSDVTPRDEEIISEISDPCSAKATLAGAKNTQVKPSTRTTTTTATARSRPTSTNTTNVKPGTPRPSARTTPGVAVRASTSTSATRTTTSTRTTPATRTPLSARTTPSSRSTSATSTSTTRTTTTSRTPLSSRTATPSATRTTPSNSATRATASSRPTATTRTTRPTSASSSTSATRTSATSRATTTTTAAASRTTSSRPTSAATTPTTARRVPLSRRPTSTKDTTDSTKPSTGAKASTTTITTTAAAPRAPFTRKPLYPGGKTISATTTTKNTSATEKKEIKNTTNKMLSTRTSTVTRTTTATKASTAAPTHRPTASRTVTGPATKRPVSSTLKSRTTTKSAPLKSKQTTDKVDDVITQQTEQKKEITTPEMNGEIKIAQEETCVEIMTKEDNELSAELVQINGDEQLITETPTNEILVNGDGRH